MAKPDKNKKVDDNEPKNFFSILFRIFGFVKPFFGLFFLAMFLNTIFSILSAISIALIKPIFQILFNSEFSNQSETVSNDFFESITTRFFDFIQWIVDSPEGKIMTLVNISILLIFVFIVKNIFKYLATVASVKFEEGIIKSIRDKVFDKLTSLSVDFFGKKKEGSIISIITNDVTVINQTTVSSINIMLRESIQIIIYIFLLLSISPYLTAIAFSTSIVSLVLMKVALKYLRRYANRMQTAMADYTSALQEAVSGIRVVKAYNAEKEANRRFTDQTGKYVNASVKHRKIITIIPSTNEVFAILALCVVLFVGGTSVLKGEMDPDNLFLFLFSLFALMSPLTTIIQSISKFQLGIVAAERVFSIFDQEPTVRSGSEKIENFKNAIEVENVSFSYEDAIVVKDTSLNLTKGKKIAFVGPSGSGKSTMLDLIIRFYDPVDGRIRIDGKDIKNIDIPSYRSLFGIVAQDTMLFNDTVVNNIKYGLSDVPFSRIEEATKIANCYNFIMNMNNGFDTVVGDRGITLSGGERQRIAIARALLRNPEILIFDEATSALDAESEKIVQDAINKSLKNRTAILVAHRLATIIHCDEIFVFDQGRIVERGTHHELITQNGVYRKLYDIQFAQKALGELD
jgi:subfamily B ATP-binding cassette protein MsbA